jgi:hypothetical protein
LALGSISSITKKKKKKKKPKNQNAEYDLLSAGIYLVHIVGGTLNKRGRNLVPRALHFIYFGVGGAGQYYGV